jgi:hypothetical protein
MLVSTYQSTWHHNSEQQHSRIHCHENATSVFGDEVQQMLKVIQCFSTQCSCHLQGECVLVGCSWKPLVFLLACLFGCSVNVLQSNQHTFTLKIVTAMFANMLDNLQHLARLVTKNRSHIKMLYLLLISHACYMSCPYHPLNILTVIVSDDKYRL